MSENKKRYTVEGQLNHDLTIYKPGDPVELSEKSALPLLEKGIISEFEPVSEETPPVDTTPVDTPPTDSKKKTANKKDKKNGK